MSLWGTQQWNVLIRLTGYTQLIPFTSTIQSTFCRKHRDTLHNQRAAPQLLNIEALKPSVWNKSDTSQVIYGYLPKCSF